MSGSAGIGNINFQSIVFMSTIKPGGSFGWLFINDKNEVHAYGDNLNGSLGLVNDQSLTSVTKIIDLTPILTARKTFVRNLTRNIISLDDGSFLITGGTGVKEFALIDTFIDKSYAYPTTQPYTAIEEKMKEPTVELIAEEVKQLKVEIDASKLEVETKQQEINLKAEELSKKIEELGKKKVPVKKVAKKKS